MAIINAAVNQTVDYAPVGMSIQAKSDNIYEVKQVRCTEALLV